MTDQIGAAIDDARNGLTDGQRSTLQDLRNTIQTAFVNVNFVALGGAFAALDAFQRDLAENPPQPPAVYTAAAAPASSTAPSSGRATLTSAFVDDGSRTVHGRAHTAPPPRFSGGFHLGPIGGLLNAGLDLLDGWLGGIAQPLTHLLDTGAALAQGVLLDIRYGVDLTSPGGDWRSWLDDLDQLQAVYDGITAAAANQNRLLLDVYGFAPADPGWVFRQLHGPLDVQYVNDDYIHLQPGDHLFDLLDGGTVLPQDTLFALTYDGQLLILHELAHVLQDNWTFVSGATLSDLYAAGGMDQFSSQGAYCQAGMPDGTGVRSSLDWDEFLSDGLAFQGADLFDLSTVDGAWRDGQLRFLLTDLVDQHLGGDLHLMVVDGDVVWSPSGPIPWPFGAYEPTAGVVIGGGA